jgi:hypothetical protein
MRPSREFQEFVLIENPKQQTIRGKGWRVALPFRRKINAGLDEDRCE